MQRAYLVTKPRAVAPAWLLRAVAVIVLAWLLLSGLLLTARTMVRATRPFIGPQFLIIACGVVGVIWLARRTSMLDSGRNIHRHWTGFLPVVATSTALLLWGVPLAHGASAPAAVFWLLVVGEEAWAWRRHIELWRRMPRAAERVVRRPAADRVVQKLTRFVTPEGEEVVQGLLAVRIEPGARMAAGHVAFCPPLVERPQLEVQPDAGPEATLKVGQLYPHGARIDVRLPQVAESETTVQVRFVARALMIPKHPG
ncbi:MAG TPA: hypothetical protein VHC22_29795 [Pirellulales bacterium]|nr:hypothetical protein [Pirellulales bacterium]